MADKLIIFDTTLRDGEQSPGASMTRDEKLRIARQLERLRVDVIEAGFAASSNGDFEAVQTIANAIKDSTVCSLSRANDRDISRAAEALKGANSGRIHTFIATSPLHMEKKLRMTPEQVLEQAKLALEVERQRAAARSLGLFGEIAPTSIASYLSGQVIGTEVAHALRSAPPSAEYAVLASPGIGGRYVKAIEIAGLKVRYGDPQAIVKGLAIIARKAGII